MPTVHSVSDITTILSDITDRTLQNVKVQGEVSVGGPSAVFFLRHAGKKIRCFMPRDKVPQFSPLLTAGNIVIVKGSIQIFPAFSEYQLRVENIQSFETNTQETNQPFTVSEITQTLSDIIENSPELTEIHVRGEIPELVQPLETTFWFLKDIAIGQQIHCVCFDGSLIQDGILVNNGNQIRIKGKIQIWGPQSRYEINVTQIESNEELCQCSGCDQCGRECDRLREVASFESCTKCLPRPPDELYELCPECYASSPDREPKVAEAVYVYFNELQVNGFSPSRKCQIQFGSRNGFADVVLGDENGGFAAIAECKGAGYEGHGREQLNSYLSATDTPFGIFANRSDRGEWEFYENRRRNRFNLITRGQFEDGVVKGITLRKRLKHEVKFLESNRDQFKHEIGDLESKKAMIVTEIGQESQKLDVLKQAIESDRAHNQDLSSIQEHLNGEITELENQRSELDITVNQIMRTKHNLNERISNLTQQIEALENYKPELHEEIRRKLEELLEEKMQKLEKPLSDLKIELQKRGIVNWFKNLFSKENE